MIGLQVQKDRTMKRSEPGRRVTVKAGHEIILGENHRVVIESIEGQRVKARAIAPEIIHVRSLKKSVEHKRELQPTQ